MVSVDLLDAPNRLHLTHHKRTRLEHEVKHTTATTRACRANSVLYYDAACPLCRKEIKKLSKKVPADAIEFKDIHRVDHAEIRDDFAHYQLLPSEIPQRDQLLKNLHLIDRSGVHIGFEANLRLWEATPYARYFAWLRFKPIYVLAKTTYSFWANIRYKKMYCDGNAECSMDAKDPTL